MAGHNAAEGLYFVLLTGGRPQCFGARNEGKKGLCVPLVDGGVAGQNLKIVGLRPQFGLVMRDNHVVLYHAQS